ncbi:MAG: hypothetical protein AAB414_02060 [Patescibacteria group bacterium]
MAYRTRSARRLARKSKRNFIITLILIGFLIYATLQWILPTLITGLGFVTSFVKPSPKKTYTTENFSLAPPVLNIPYEATNTAQINISGYGTPDSKVSIYIDDEKKDTTEVSPDGTFEIKNVSLVLGTNSIYGKSIDPDFIGVDENEKESLPSKVIKVIYDSEKPLLEISEPEDGKIQQGEKKVKISGRTESQAKVSVNDSQVVVGSDGIFNIQLQLNDGENVLNIKAQDLAGNSQEISRRVVFNP